MKIKKALKAYYEGINSPEGIEYDVLYKIEKEKSKKWKKIVLLESFLFILFVITVAYLFLSPVNYRTMGMEGVVKVKLVKDISLMELSDHLSRLSLRIEGPYHEREFYLIGDEEKIKEFLENTDAFKRLN